MDLLEYPLHQYHSLDVVRAGQIDVLRVFLAIYVIGDMISQIYVVGNIAMTVSLKMFIPPWFFGFSNLIIPRSSGWLFYELSP